jgi:formylglycine-generating enzyme required for sulfatase activity
MTFIFISYARRDGSDEAEQLFQALNAENITAWRDTRSLNPYEGFDAEIEKAIETATHVCVCVTPDIRREDSFVRREIAFAIEMNKPIIPLVFPGGFRPITIINHTYIDFANWDAGMLALFNRLRNPNDAPETEPEHKREKELAYLEIVGQRYDHWRDLYTDMSARARVETPKVRVRTAAAARYLDMQHGIFDRIAHNEEAETLNMQTVDNFLDLREGVLKHQRVALIGDPGAGKTTTLERLAYELATAAAESDDAAIPLFARLGAYTGGDFDSFLAAAFAGLPLTEYLPDRVFLLLDGLNEMPPEFVARVDTWLRAHKETATIVTCRRLDYMNLKLDLHRIDVMPLDVRRIYAFVGNYIEDDERDRLFWGLTDDITRKTWSWFQDQYERDVLKFAEVFGGKAEETLFETFWHGTIKGQVFEWEDKKLHLKSLQSNLRQNGSLPGMLGVVSNPFLLFISVNLFARQGEPPANRGQLFDQFAALLMEKRGRPAARTRPPWIEESVQRAALAVLAYQMQIENTGTSVEETWAKKIIESAFPDEDPAQILYLAASAGILEQSNKAIRFVHQLLGEYFATYGMKIDVERNVPASKYFPHARWWEPTGWEETAIMLAGMSGDATAIVRWLTPVQPSLAYRCATESGASCDEAALQALYEPAPGSRVSPQARARWGRILARTGDKRAGVGVKEDGTPDFVWCEIPGGDFIYQEGEKRNLPTFYMTKYPVTFIQFQGFLDAADGYCEDHWWDGLQFLDMRKANPEKRQPGGQNWPYPNHPRERVSWYDSVAYARWLSYKLGYEVRLPTEEEWEKAARGTDGRIYPWGDVYTPGDANINEQWDNTGPNAIRMTTAVGMYPHNVSPYRVCDLIGNVWEWTLSEYETGRSDNLASETVRTQRGGSWRSNLAFSSAVHRHGNRRYPARREYHVGLRLITEKPH